MAQLAIKKMPILPPASIDKATKIYKHPYEFYKEKAAFETNEQLVYDKVRWPMYREVIMKRKNLVVLPSTAKNVSKLIGMLNVPLVIPLG